MVNASADGSAGVGTAGVGTAVPVAAGESETAAPRVPRGAGGWDGDAGGLPHGLAMATPMKATMRTTTSAVTRRSFRPPVLGDP
jgi:hypothetical protein